MPELVIVKEQEELHKVVVSCPDCNATLEIVSSKPISDDIRVKFIRHNC